MTNTEILQRVAQREFLHFWERSICADMMCKWWLRRVMERV